MPRGGTVEPRLQAEIKSSSELPPLDLRDPFACWPFHGARRLPGPTCAVVLRRGDSVIGGAFLARYRQALLPAWVAEGVAIGPFAMLEPRPDVGMPELATAEVYQTVAGCVLSGGGGPRMISVVIDSARGDEIDALWRFAAALPAECVVRVGYGVTRLDIYLDGIRGGLAHWCASAPGALLASAIRSRLARLHVVRGQAREAHDRSMWFAVESGRRRPARVALPGLHFRIATPNQIAEAPLRYGLSLQTSAPPANVLVFEALLDAVVVFRIVGDLDQRRLAEIIPPAIREAVEAPSMLLVAARTEREFRGRSIYPAALRRVVEYAMEHGIRSVVISTRADNTASRRGIEKAGFVHIATVDGV